jgi:hypothetical protein
VNSAEPTPFERHALTVLAATRIAVGLLILARTTALLAPLEIPFLADAVPFLGWPDGAYALGPFAPSLVRALCVVRSLAAVSMIVGPWPRAAAIVCAGAGYLVLAEYPLEVPFTLLLLYQAALLLALSDSASRFALLPAAPRSPKSSLALLRWFIASIYLWAGLTKLRADWLDGRTLTLLLERDDLHGVVAEWLRTWPASKPLVASGTAGFELLLGPALLWRPTRRVALLLAWTFHVGLELVAQPDLLGFAMITLLVVFWEQRTTSR